MRQPVKLTTPRYWEPEEALPVWELLTELADTLWAQHYTSFLKLLCEQRNPDRGYHDLDDSGEWAQLDLFAPDDDLPF